MPFFRFESQVMQIHSALSALLKPVRQDSTTSGEHTLYLFASHFTTEHLYQSWSQQVHTYSGPCAMFLWKKFIIQNWVTFVFSCVSTSLLHVSCDTLGRSWNGVSVSVSAFFGISIYFFDVLRVIQFLFSGHLFVNFPYVLCILCFSSSCCLFIDFLNMLQVLCFSFSHYLLVNFPYVLCVLSILFSHRLFVHIPYVLWVLSFCFSTDCLLISLVCSGLFAFCFLTVCLLIFIMNSGFFAFHFLKEWPSISLTCSRFSFLFLAAWFFLFLVVLLIMQLLCSTLPFSIFLNFSSALLSCIPSCRLLCKFYVSYCGQLECFNLHFMHICCCFQSSTFKYGNIMNFIWVPNVNT